MRATGARLKERLGLFEIRTGAARSRNAVDGHRGSTAHRARRRRALDRDAEERAATTLPLAGATRRLCVIGPLARCVRRDARARGPPRATTNPASPCSTGLRDALPDAEIVFAQGRDDFGHGPRGHSRRPSICAAAECHDRAVPRRSRRHERRSGKSRAFPDLPGEQRALAEAVLDRAAQGRHLRVIVVLFSGRPLVVPWLAERADALLAAWFLGTEAGNAIADVLTGRVRRAGARRSPGRARSGRCRFLRPAHAGGRRIRRITSPASISTSPNSPLFPFGHGLTYGRFVCCRICACHRRRATESQIASRSPST